MKKRVSAILLIAGSSTRYQKGYNKNFEIMNNHPLFYYSLKVMDNHPNIQEILLVIKKEEEQEVKEFLQKESFQKKIILVYGGSTRKESVFHALQEANENIVCIHDGARPFIQKEYINQCIEYMDSYRGVIVGVPVKDTIKIVNEQKEIETSTNREFTYIGQTPQCFDKELLRRLHERYQDDSTITDDSILLEREKIKVKVIPGSYHNIKLTTKEDYYYVKELLEKGDA